MNNDLFVIDLSGCNNTGEIITSVSTAFEVPEAKERKIGLKLNDITLNQAQMLSIQSLIASYASELSYIETPNETTKNTCENMGINVQLCEKPQTIAQEEIAFEIPKTFQGNGETENAIMQGNGAQDFAGNNTLEFQGNGLNSGMGANGEMQGNGFEEFKPIEFNEDGKQIMETYKKAYDEDEEEKQTWEEVDYYAPPTDEPVIVDSKQTIYVNQTLRSGQVLEFDGNVVIIGDCHPGSEIKATGDITVWGVLGSIAHAGAKGNRDAKIRALKMNAVQLRIADCYSRRPDGTNIPYIIKSSVFTPEEARIVDDSIVLFKIN